MNVQSGKEGSNDFQKESLHGYWLHLDDSRTKTKLPHKKEVSGLSTNRIVLIQF